MRMQSPRAVSELLTSAIPQLEDRLREQQLQRSWESIVGGDVARRTRPGTLVNGTLHVIVDNSPWLHELTLRAPDLQARLARYADVRALRFVLGSIDAPDRDASHARDDEQRPSSPRLAADELAEIDAAAATIPDAALANAARRLLTTARRWSVAREPR